MEEILKILIWPLVVVIFFLIFRKELSELINRLNINKIIIGEKFSAIFNQFKPIKEKNANENLFFEEIYKKTTGAQLQFLEVLRESMRGNSKGMDCGYVSHYFINIIGSKTNRYHGWITPFITAYLQENDLVKVENNFFSLTKKGTEFLEYTENKEYPLSKERL